MELQDLLKNREVTSIRIVTTPEKMVVEETKRNYMYMNLYDFNVDGLYINRILPKDIGNDFFNEWIEIQQKYIGELKATFAALPIYEIPWYDEELKGEENIRRITDDVLKGDEVFKTRVITQREHFEQTEDGYSLTVYMPGADKKEIEMYQVSNDIVIKTGNFKRNIPLPNILRTYVVAGAKFEDGKLKISFEAE
jgi:arsenite-transporting ATPase